jgi:hypothetical protein
MLLPQTGPRAALTSVFMRGYDVLPDGRILSLVPLVDQDLAGARPGAELRIVLGWFEELKRLAPAK